MVPPLDEPTRALLQTVADLLAPAGDGMPSASEVDACGKWLDRILEADPALLEPLRELASCTDWAAITAFHARSPALFESATFALLSAYYLHPRVRRLLGYPGQGPSPILEGESDHYLRDGLIDAVVARGPFYVGTPDG